LARRWPVGNSLLVYSSTSEFKNMNEVLHMMALSLLNNAPILKIPSQEMNKCFVVQVQARSLHSKSDTTGARGL
jgi:hypothetical protein